MTDLGIEILYVRKIHFSHLNMSEKSASVVEHVGKVRLRSWNMWEKSNLGIGKCRKSSTKVLEDVGKVRHVCRRQTPSAWSFGLASSGSDIGIWR
jgi:hypothetical protein